VAVLREFGEKGKHIGAELLLKVSTQSCLEKVAAARKAGRPPQQPITGNAAADHRQMLRDHTGGRIPN
jgi:hypothetical protein